MSDSKAQQANQRTVIRSFVIVLAMFAFGFALVPIYNLVCHVTGLNGKTGRIDADQVLVTEIDKDRLVTVEFISNVNDGLPWEFRPDVRKMQVHPGAINKASYFARNFSDRVITGQAIPSLAPAQAARYFNKIECFCFTQQTFGPGEERDMPLRFIVDPKLPKRIKTVTLSYTFFDASMKVDKTKVSLVK